MSLPDGYVFRRVQEADHVSYCETLRVLTTVGEISPANFSELVAHWSLNAEMYHPHVIVNEKGQVVATGMLLVERKLIHDCGLVGHIEDVAVSPVEQGKRLGQYMITHLTELAAEKSCYKVILDCDPKNQAFYEKCGYSNAGCEMSHRFI